MFVKFILFSEAVLNMRRNFYSKMTLVPICGFSRLVLNTINCSQYPSIDMNIFSSGKEVRATGLLCTGNICFS